MSKLARTVVLAAMVAAMNLAGLVAVAQAHTSNDPASARHTALGRVEFPATGQAARQAADATVRRLLAQERYYSTWDYENPTIQQALAQERYYSTWAYGDTAAPAPDEPSGQPGWLTPALGVLAAVLAMVAGVAVLAARRANRSLRASQAA
jgi:hypothetical protein